MAETRLPGWKDIPLGCAVLEPMSTRRNLTGSWRSERPVWDFTKCVKCGVCWMYCPDECIYEREDGYFEADLNYCKGCGICARECWTQCITMVKEEM